MASGGSTKGTSNARRAAEERALDHLIARARAGDEAALEQLIERLSEQLWAELNSRRRSNRTGPTHGSSDLIQDTLVRVKEMFDKFERDTFADFKQWARTVLYRRRLEWARNHHARNGEKHKRMIWNALRDRAETGGPDEYGQFSVEENEELERAYLAYKGLKSNEQLIIKLRLFQKLSYKQIAELAETTEEAARKLYDRAIARLRTSLSNHDDD